MIPVPPDVEGWVQGRALSLVMSRIAKRHKRARLLIPLDVSNGSSVGEGSYKAGDCGTTHPACKSPSVAP